MHRSVWKLSSAITCANCATSATIQCGRYWTRTSDLFRVKEARYHCANRPLRMYATDVQYPRQSSVGDTGLEPVTSSVSRKRATTAPIARTLHREVATGFEPVYTALQAAASPLGHATKSQAAQNKSKRQKTRADDEIRTRDPHLGKVMRYHCATSATEVF